ncbi:carbohydrate-binding protein [Bacillus cereus]|nr:carbohydrate-binding protein [Bacillus cereus]
MKNKKKQLIKGIMLSTVLGLGWSVVGDVSHAAGNEISQTAEWNKKIKYVKGDIVTYNGIQYVTQQSICGFSPDEIDVWKPMNGAKPGWNAKEGYAKGDKVLYNGTIYELMWGTIIGKSPDEYIYWKIMSGKIPKWSEQRGYVEGEKVTYDDSEYQATELILGGKKPNESGSGWKEIEGAKSQAKEERRLVNKELSDILSRKEGAKSQAKAKLVEPKKIERWSAYHLYEKGDIVTYNKIQYKAQVWSQSQRPNLDKSEFWKQQD